MEKINSITLEGVREFAKKKLVGFRVVCEDMTGYGQEIPEASMSLERRKAAETSEEDDGYWVCFEVHEFEDIPAGMVRLVVPAQKYAVLNFNGHASEIFQVYTHLHKWIGENGYKRVPDKWSLEIYSKWPKSEDKVDLCDPVL
ncbi:GyrI-like domain-containing protein [Sediminibacillus albus]|uniref:GyrI-like small molecule binding domain-containing protein n=1 Tax=Sediminibacillus albus TaxID=407036 RepID=A0A1G8WG34_9BACI|nr:GyrI-like domain-containing protein [Sediminibacillus albus]SDJ77264.1 GyrI-like small molecule binding domain-containing protein [Sediminibacillus albus]